MNGDQSDNMEQLAGAAYVIVRNGTTWNQQAYLKASNSDSMDFFGGAVAISGDTMVIGAIGEQSFATGVNGYEHNNGAPDAGAAYVFDISPWTDLGHGLAGWSFKVPRLAGDGTLVPGSPTTLTLNEARPWSVALLVIGISQVNTPLRGGTLVPSLDVVIHGLPVNGLGELVIGANWPPLSSGVSLYFQYWVADSVGPWSFAASNGLMGTTP